MLLHFLNYNQLGQKIGMGCKYTTKAQGFLHSLTSGRTIIALVILNHVLDIVKGLSAKLQKHDADIVMAASRYAFWFRKSGCSDYKQNFIIQGHNLSSLWC